MQLSDLVSKPFQEALSKLVTASLPVQTTLKLRKITKLVNEEVKEFNSLREELFKEFGEKKEDGTLNIKEDGTLQLDVSRKEEWIAKLDELTTATCDFPKIKGHELGSKLELSALELAILDGIIED